MIAAFAAVGGRAPRLEAGVAVERSPEGALRLTAPLKRRGPHRWIARLARLRERTVVELDAVGAWTVERFDGRSLDRLADDLAERFRLDAGEARVALGQFMQALLARRLARLDDGTAA